MKTAFVLLALVALTLSCKKETPVTPDPASVVFYTGNNGPAIDVWIDGATDPANPTGTISKYWLAGAPDCFAEGAVTVTLSPGTHVYNAKPKSGTKYWSGSFTVDKASKCMPLRFDR